MGVRASRAQYAGVAAIGAVVLVVVGAAMAATSVTKHFTGFFAIPARQTRTLFLPYPDALEYGNARYSGRTVVLGP